MTHLEMGRAHREQGGASGATRVLQQLMDSVADALLAIDARGMIAIANPAAERLFGYRPGELVGKPAERLMPEQSRRHWLAAARQPQLHGGLHLRGLRKDGGEIRLEVTLRCVVLGRRRLVLAATRDPAEGHRAEQTLDESENKFKTIFERCPAWISIASLEDGRYRTSTKSFSRPAGLGASR